MSTYRAGVIGCGSVAQMHMRGYEGVEEIEVVALADPVEEALNAFGERYGVSKRYRDPREMLDSEQLDIVSICTWHKLHAPLTIAACARKPKAVLCEKPMATSLGACDQMMIAARRNKVKLAIAHQRRFNPAWTDARIAEAFDCRVQTIENLRKRLVTMGFELALHGKKRQTPPTAPLLDGRGEAKLIALRLGKPPAGYGRWTLQLLADELVALEIVESISYETVRRTLKKRA